MESSSDRVIFCTQLKVSSRKVETRPKLISFKSWTMLGSIENSLVGETLIGDMFGEVINHLVLVERLGERFFREELNCVFLKRKFEFLMEEFAGSR